MSLQPYVLAAPTGLGRNEIRQESLVKRFDVTSPVPTVVFEKK